MQNKELCAQCPQSDIEQEEKIFCKHTNSQCEAQKIWRNKVKPILSFVDALLK